MNRRELLKSAPACAGFAAVNLVSVPKQKSQVCIASNMSESSFKELLAALKRNGIEPEDIELSAFPA